MIKRPKREFQWSIRLSHDELSRIRTAAILNDEDMARLIRRGALNEARRVSGNE